MSEEAAFLEAMLANPNDLALRLVFADWLEERGDPRGELLRLTHTLTQAIDVPQRADLEARVQQLMREGVQPIGPFWTNAFSMRFALLPPGIFLMGSPESEQDMIRKQYGGQADEWIGLERSCRVVLSQAFALSTTPITQSQWQIVTGSHLSEFQGNDHPVETLSWLEAVRFCNTLSAKDNRQPYYRVDGEQVTIVGGNGYRLPTEAEWEYACRAGTTTAYSFGDDASDLDAHAWHRHNASDQLHAVGQYPCNAWGLYDMHGNIWEWCWDWYGDYPLLQATDPQGPESGTGRVVRGGSWQNTSGVCRSASRCWYPSAGRHIRLGLRACFRLD